MSEVESSIGRSASPLEKPVLQSAATPSLPRKPLPRPSYVKNIIFFSVASGLFWLLEFFFQYYIASVGDLQSSLIRSFAFAGETLFALTLLMSVIFRSFPSMARHWRFRRYAGVAGFVFITAHVLTVLQFLFQFHLGSVFYSLNPIANPLLFGVISFPLFMVMALTSTDWAVQKLGSRVWKNIHRLVYVAFIASIFHFLLTYIGALKNAAGALLVVMTAAAVMGHLYWFVKLSAKKSFKSKGFMFGACIIAVTAVVAYLAYR